MHHSYIFCGDRISNYSENASYNIQVFLTIQLQLKVFPFFRSWQRSQLYPNHWWFSQSCLAPQELSATPQKALNEVVNMRFYTFCASLDVIKTFLTQHCFVWFYYIIRSPWCIMHARPAILGTNGDLALLLVEAQVISRTFNRFRPSRLVIGHDVWYPF